MFHYSAVAMVRLSIPGSDVQSPSGFVKAAKQVKGVEDAFRTLGRFDAAVFLHGDSDEDVRRAALALQRIPNVAHVEFLVGVPARGSRR